MHQQRFIVVVKFADSSSVTLDEFDSRQEAEEYAKIAGLLYTSDCTVSVQETSTEEVSIAMPKIDWQSDETRALAERIARDPLAIDWSALGDQEEGEGNAN